MNFNSSQSSSANSFETLETRTIEVPKRRFAHSKCSPDEFGRVCTREFVRECKRICNSEFLEERGSPDRGQFEREISERHTPFAWEAFCWSFLKRFFSFLPLLTGCTASSHKKRLIKASLRANLLSRGESFRCKGKDCWPCSAHQQKWLLRGPNGLATVGRWEPFECFKKINLDLFSFVVWIKLESENVSLSFLDGCSRKVKASKFAKVLSLSLNFKFALRQNLTTNCPAGFLTLKRFSPL